LLNLFLKVGTGEPTLSLIVKNNNGEEAWVGGEFKLRVVAYS
jgi:hypothetical protein